LTAHSIAPIVEQVLAVTQDGRVIVGTLRGFDNVGSVILSGCVERIFTGDAGVEEVPLGLYIVRGDAM
jgi:U6 snRNA-associated Sm-like protein LSm8